MEHLIIVDDLYLDSVPVPVTYRDKTYTVYFRPEKYTDKLHREVQEAFPALSAALDFSPLDPALVGLIADWDLFRVVRDEAGRPLASDGSPLVDTATQRPKIEKLPVNADTMRELGCFLKKIGRAHV